MERLSWLRNLRLNQRSPNLNALPHTEEVVKMLSVEQRVRKEEEE